MATRSAGTTRRVPTASGPGGDLPPQLCLRETPISGGTKIHRRKSHYRATPRAALRLPNRSDSTTGPAHSLIRSILTTSPVSSALIGNGCCGSWSNSSDDSHQRVDSSGVCGYELPAWGASMQSFVPRSCSFARAAACPRRSALTNWGQPAVQSLLVGTVGPTNYCYWPMPFDRGIKIEMSSERASPVQFEVEVVWTSVPRGRREEQLDVEARGPERTLDRIGIGPGLDHLRARGSQPINRNR
jgi:hypothetical protein